MLKTVRLWHLLVISIVTSEVLSAIIVSVMSIVLKGRIVLDYLLTSAVTSAIVAAIIVSIILYFIKELKHTEEALRKSESLRRGLFLTTPIGISVVKDRTFIDVNHEFCNIVGYNENELIGDTTQMFYESEEERERVRTELYSSLWDKGFTCVETRHLRKDGEVRDIVLRAAPILPNDASAGVVVAIEDITERKQAETELKKSEKKYRQIYDNILDVYYEASLDGTILEISPSIEKISKYTREELIGKCIYDVYTYPAEGDRLVEKLIKDGHISEYELHLTDKDGTRHICSFTTTLIKNRKGDPKKSVGTFRDISERKQHEMEKMELEERLVRSQKMESLGLLAGGVAHDLNNVLSGIVSYPDLLLIDLPEDSPLRKPILTIQSSGQKAAEIVQDLLTLARRGVSISEVLNLNEIIIDYLKSPEYNKLLKYNPDVYVKTNLETELLNIKGSSIHLKKTIMNLVSNAAEAQSSFGKIVISTKNKYIDIPMKGYEEIREGDYAILEVADKGTGIANEDLSRIFEPFYTKKVMGRSGTGLGMAVVWGTVQDHHGYINIESSEGEGTTFYLYFPITREKPEKDKDLKPIDDYLGNKETILIVDDVKEQREIAASILNRLNYSVTAVSSGEAAVEYMKINSADLLVLDMIMDPGIDGLETFKKILEYHPRQKAVIASGFTEIDLVEKAQKHGLGQYIRKPYTLEKIGTAVKTELGK